VGQFPKATNAFAKAAELRPTDARLLSDYADALAMTSGRRLDGEPMKLIKRALALDPKEVKALALAGTDAFERKDYKAAVAFWERAVKEAPPDQRFAEQLRGSIEEARAKEGLPGSSPPPVAEAASDRAPDATNAAAGPTGHAVIRGRVKLVAALASKTSPNDTVFIFARAQGGPGVPVAMMKRHVKDLPMDFSLDETMAMVPEMNLSKFSKVVIGARVSRSGDAIASSGDMQGFSGPVEVGASGVQVQIDQVVP
jgi:cytochrome c-type biogenesis protein CcmH